MPRWEFPSPEPDDYRARIVELGAENERPVRDQHVVSRVILKGFAAPGKDQKGWELVPFDVKRQREMKRTGLRGCGKITNFVLFASASAERRWKTVEDELPGAIVGARTGKPSQDDVSVIKDAIALHLVRSIRYLQVHKASVRKAADDVRRELLGSRSGPVEREFYRRSGLYPAGPEALVSIVDEPVSEWLEWDSNGALARVSIEKMFDRMRAGLARHSLEIGRTPPGCELLISDSPAVTYQYMDDGKTVRSNVAVGDSHGVFLPIARDCMVGISGSDLQAELNPGQVDVLNKLQVQAAHTFVYYHPGGRMRPFIRQLFPESYLLG